MTLAVTAYQRWQQIAFWISWVALLIPGYCLGFGTLKMAKLIGAGYSDQADWLVLSILALGFIALALVAILTIWAYQTASRGYWNLMTWQIVGLLVIPLLTLVACLLVYFQLVLQGVLPPH